MAKTGANHQQQNRIKLLTLQGKSVQEIAGMMNLEYATVESFASNITENEEVVIKAKHRHLFGEPQTITQQLNGGSIDTNPPQTRVSNELGKPVGAIRQEAAAAAAAEVQDMGADVDTPAGDVDPIVPEIVDATGENTPTQF